MYTENKEKIKEIVDSFDIKLRNPEQFILAQLEAEFKNEFNIGYKGVKDIINSLYTDGICKNICYKYAKKHEVSEFKWLIKDYELNNK